jgi:hypothetical protein
VYGRTGEYIAAATKFNNLRLFDDTVFHGIFLKLRLAGFQSSIVGIVFVVSEMPPATPAAVVVPK